MQPRLGTHFEMIFHSMYCILMYESYTGNLNRKHSNNFAVEIQKL